MKKIFILKDQGKGTLNNVNPNSLVCIGNEDFFSTTTTTLPPTTDVNFDVTADWNNMSVTGSKGAYVVFDVESFTYWLINGDRNSGFTDNFGVTNFNIESIVVGSTDGVGRAYTTYRITANILPTSAVVIR